MSMYGFINLLQCCKVISLQLIKINGKKKKSYPGLHRGDESWGLGPWAPSVFSSESEEAGHSWVGGLLLGTRTGMSRSLEGIWSVDLC